MDDNNIDFLDGIGGKSIGFEVNYSSELSEDDSVIRSEAQKALLEVNKHINIVYELLKDRHCPDYNKAQMHLDAAENVANSFKTVLDCYSFGHLFRSIYRYRSEVLFKQSKDPDVQFYYAFMEFALWIYEEVYNQNRMGSLVKEHMIKTYGSLDYHFYDRQRKRFEENGFGGIQLSNQFDHVEYPDWDEDDEDAEEPDPIYTYPRLEPLKHRFYNFCFVKLKELAEKADQSVDYYSIIRQEAIFYLNALKD